MVFCAVMLLENAAEPSVVMDAFVTAVPPTSDLKCNSVLPDVDPPAAAGLYISADCLPVAFSKRGCAVGAKDDI